MFPIFKDSFLIFFDIIKYFEEYLLQKYNKPVGRTGQLFT